MTYEDLMKSSDWVKDMSASYFESAGAKVLIFKLDKSNTKLNPIYNEEIDGRKYLRPYEAKSIYKTNPFDFSFDNTLPSETEGSLNFYFNFELMVRTLESFKKATSEIKITSVEDGWSIWKSGNILSLYNKTIFPDTETKRGLLEFNLEQYQTVSELSQALTNTEHFICKTSGDDYSTCIPNFKETKLSKSIILKTFNGEFKGVSNVIEEGDLIYITTINALFEVTSAYPVNNTIYRYMNWQCNAQRTFSYVEYEKLKTYKYGFGLTDYSGSVAKADVSIKEEGTLDYNIATDEQIQSIIENYKPINKD